MTVADLASDEKHAELYDLIADELDDDVPEPPEWQVDRYRELERDEEEAA